VAVAGDFHCRVWIVEARIRAKAQTVLLKAVCPTRYTRSHLRKGLAESSVNRSKRAAHRTAEEQKQILPVLLKKLLL
jgi:hypothetical protein